MNNKLTTLIPFRLPTQIYVDGASRGNPGPSGCGLVIYQDNQVTKQMAGGYAEHATNNLIELTALKEALKVAQIYTQDNTPVEILSDSDYALKCVFEWSAGWMRRGWQTAQKKPVQNVEIIKECVALAQTMKGKLQVIHINGHSGVEGNEVADQLANRAVNEQLTEWTEISIADNESIQL